MSNVREQTMNTLAKLLLLTLSIIMLGGCAANMVTIEKLEAGLNSMVGIQAPSYTKTDVYWKPINKTETHTEKELIRPDGCAYAILINNSTNIVESWRFTSEESLCERHSYAPSV